MKKIKGEVLNSKVDLHAVIGKVTTKPIRKKSSMILVSNSKEINIKNYSCFITSENISHFKLEQTNNTNIVHKVTNIDTLKDGDILFIDLNSGVIEVRYEYNSVHNSLFLNHSCNLKCVMCPQPPKKDTSSLQNENLQIIKLIDKGTRSLCITGGEPTINKSNLLEILRTCRSELPETTYLILTNGFLLKEENYVREIVRSGNNKLLFCIPLHSDIDFIHDQISQKKKSFENSILGILNLAKYRQLIEIRVVVNALNYKRLEEISNFIYHNFPFTYRIAFVGMETIGLAKYNLKKIWVHPTNYKHYLRRAVLNLSRRNMNVFIFNEQLCLISEDLWSFTYKSISEWKNVYLDKCERCTVKQKCGGLFQSTIEFRGDSISPL